MKCNYCGCAAKRVTGKRIYPYRRDLQHKRFWLCVNCDAYVGCHPDGRPLGILADPHLRNARQKTHHEFDKFWKSGRLSRTEAYKMLAREMNIPKSRCHIGMFNIEQCREAYRACRRMRKTLNERQREGDRAADSNSGIPDLEEGRSTEG